MIKYSINKVPNPPKLNREIKDGLIKNYGAAIVIDSSLSCLNEFSKYHTLLTISALLRPPIVIFSGKIGSQILSEKSQFWIALLSLLKGYKNTNLASGIKAAFNIIRARRITNKIYVIPDGLYIPSQRERIIGVVKNDGYLRTGSFMKKKQEFESIERKSISNNLVKIYKEIKLYYANGNIYTFIPFSKDSKSY